MKCVICGVRETEPGTATITLEKGSTIIVFNESDAGSPTPISGVGMKALPVSIRFVAIFPNFIP